jgi:predicted RNA-binding Zn-ribbon protein involved in translation (DUF1610 family)
MCHSCAGALSGKRLEKETCPTCGRELIIKTGNGFGADAKKECPNPDCNPFKGLTGKIGFGNV